MAICNSSAAEKQGSLTGKPDEWIFRTEGFHESVNGQHATTIKFVAPPDNQKWDAKLAVLHLNELTKSECLVLLCLIDHANRFRAHAFQAWPVFNTRPTGRKTLNTP